MSYYKLSYKKKSIIVLFHKMPAKVDGITLKGLNFMSEDVICINTLVPKRDTRRVFHKLIKKLFNN